MTSYHGGKQKFGKEIAYEIFLNSLDILEKQNNIEIKGYCEPFCGMMGVYQHIHDIFDNKIKYKAGDLNESVILLWKKLKNTTNISTKGKGIEPISIPLLASYYVGLN
jgi:site-specific DNA-adenine methylase